MPFEIDPQHPMAWYRGNLAWLPDRTIFLTKSGSQAYGTALPTSDLDVKGVAVPPRAYFLGYLHRFEQAEAKGDPLDAVVYDVRKFAELAAACNPNIIEMLFTGPADWLISTPAWQQLYVKRHLFLSQRARHTFSGYAHAQLKRIKTHRRWLLEPPQKQPSRADYDLPTNEVLGKEQLAVVEAEIRKRSDQLAGTGLTKDQLAGREVELVVETITALDLQPNLIPAIIAERKYGAAMRNWKQYLTWQQERNPARAALEARHGYDTKHGMHLVRLMRMATEILRDGEVRVRRPDAVELLEIRHGAWPYELLERWAARMEQYLAALTSALPREPDREAVDRVVVAVVESML